MYMCHDLNDTNIWDSLAEDLPKCRANTDSNMPPQVPTVRWIYFNITLNLNRASELTRPYLRQALVYVVRACFYSVLWSLHSLEEKVSSQGMSPGIVAEADLLKQRVTVYADHCRKVTYNILVINLSRTQSFK